MNLHDFIKVAMDLNASDLFIVAGTPLSVKVHNELVRIETEDLSPSDTKALIEEIYTLAQRPFSQLSTYKDDDFSFSVQKLARFRVNAYTQRSSFAAVLRVVKFELPNAESLNIPKEIINLSNLTKGLVLISGPSGSGKSTTMACILDAINTQRKAHIITLEDPIEFLHKHKQSIVSQREIHSDCQSSTASLKSALRQAPDVLFIGEMRDLETISLAITAAETGHLVFSTLHTLGAMNTIDRILDVFPSEHQQQIRVQLSMVLQAVVSQQLIPSINGTVIPVFELMKSTTAIRNQIREGKTHQLNTSIQTSKDEGSWTMDMMLQSLLDASKISLEVAQNYALEKELIKEKA